MQPVKFLCCLVMLFASCRSIRQTAVLPADVNHIPIAYAVSPKVLLNETVSPEPAIQIPEPMITEEMMGEEKTTAELSPALAQSNAKKVQSFTQWKKMAANNEIKMSKKDVKFLNKLEKKYKGNFEKFRADTFEFTTKAKIIAGVGLIGLLLAIFTGSWFGAFLFILAALGFLLRFVGAIEF